MTGDWPILLAAAFGAGLLNAMAGGGSFLTLPALVHAGVPPVVANATGTAALLPGYIGSCLGFRREIFGSGRPQFWPALVCLAGGMIGAILLAQTSNAAFSRIVPWLLVLATVLFALGPIIVRHAGGRGESPAVMLGGLFAVSVYGGYFNGGLGILLLAQLGLAGVSDLRIANGLKNLFSALLTLIAVGVYAIAGQVIWPYALGMAGAAVAGGYLGARLALILPALAVRVVVIVIGIAMSIYFFMR